jgi:serine protease Do
LSAAQGNTEAATDRDNLAKKMTPAQITESQRLATAFVAHNDSGALYAPKASGTGFFVTKDAFVVTAFHVVDGASRIVIKTKRARFVAQLVRADKTNDIALLKIIGAFPPLTLTNQANSEAQEAALYKIPDAKLFKVVGDFSPLAIADASAVKLGEAVSTIGFPNLQIQGSEPKYTRGEVNSLAGVRDDARYFQISAPVQPGNSGGPLLDTHGNVIGLVVSRLNDVTLLRATGTLPQNVNYALKSSVVIRFLKSVPGMKEKMESSSTATNASTSDDWLTNAQKSIVVVLVF